jgi:DNA primase
MIPLPTIVSRHNLRFCLPYKDEYGKVVALVARYDIPGSKKKFHQYQLTEAGQWKEGMATPSPLYGLETLPKIQSGDTVYIFEGEKCATALHTFKLPALTSMMGANQAHNTDWAILAKYRHVKEFVLIPDNDEPGQNYMKTVFQDLDIYLVR